MTRIGNEIVDAAGEGFGFAAGARRRQMAVAELSRESESGLDFVVRGDCMAPLFRAGDRVRVEARETYLPGDVLAFVDGGPDAEEAGERFLVHRLLGYDRRSGRLHYVTGADAASGFDPPFPSERLLGRVIAISRDQENFEPVPIGLTARCSAILRFFRLALPAVFRRLGRVGR